MPPKPSMSTISPKLFNVPLIADEKKIWQRFLVDKVKLSEEDSKAESVYIDPGWEAHWKLYLDKANEDALVTATTRMLLPTVEERTQKALKKLARDPGNFNGERSQFTTWWTAMRLYLKGYEDSSDQVKIIGVLSRLQTGEAAIWAKNREEVISGTLNSWNDFKKKLEGRFADLTRKQRASNDLHNFIHRGSLTRYLDLFESLKSISGTTDKMAAFYLQRGVSAAVMKQLYGTIQEVPEEYTELMKSLRALAQNQELAWNYQLSLNRPQQRQLWYLMQDKQTDTGITYGG